MKRSVLFGALVLIASAAHGQITATLYWNAWQRQGEAMMARSCAEMVELLEDPPE